MVYVWVAVILFAIGTEAATAELVAIWFMPAAAVAMVLALCGVPLWIQLTVFFLLVVACLLFARRYLARALRRHPPEKTNADSLIGLTAIVTERVDNEAQTGAVRINGLEWSARSTSVAVVLEPDTLVVVRHIEGVKLICEPK